MNGLIFRIVLFCTEEQYALQEILNAHRVHFAQHAHLRCFEKSHIALYCVAFSVVVINCNLCQEQADMHHMLPEHIIVNLA